MKSEKTIKRKIDKYSKLIEKFRSDNTLDKEKKKGAIFKLQMLNRELKWVLKIQ